MSWNHNVQYHDDVTLRVRSRCRLALDVGCGQGELARKLAAHSEQVLAIDSDWTTVRAAAHQRHPENVHYAQADLLHAPLAPESVDLIAAVAVLHHLPLERALETMRDLLRPGGRLVVVGLYRSSTLLDYLVSGMALPVSWVIRRCVGTRAVGAPVQEPKDTLVSIRRVCARYLPGHTLRRKFFFRYVLVWTKNA